MRETETERDSKISRDKTRKREMMTYVDACKLASRTSVKLWKPGHKLLGSSDLGFPG